MHDPTATLADLAARLPAASRVFRRHGLDYCCGGQRSVAEACSRRGLDPHDILAELEQETVRPGDPACFVDRPLGELVAHIVRRYHEPLREELPALIELASRVESRHADKASCPRGLAAHLTAMHADVLTHLAKEEQVLFPMILAGAGGRAQGPVSVLLREHDDHGAGLRRIRELTADLVAPAEACPTWRALYLRLAELEAELMDHIHLENNVLFPGALRSLSVAS